MQQGSVSTSLERLLPSQAKATARLPMLDCSRGFAAILVVLFHAATTVSLPKYFKVDVFNGRMLFCGLGVDFFFVLSGFIITYVHWFDLGKAECLPLYLKKRFIRVYPIHWFVTLPLLAVSPLLTPERIPREIGEKLQLFVGSLLLIPTRILPIPGVLWTLKHEIVFYTIFAGIIWKPRLGAAFLACWLAGCGWHAIVGPDDSGFLMDFLLSPYNTEFVVGVCVGAAVRYRRMPVPELVVVLGLLWLIKSAIDYRLIDISKPWIVHATSAAQVVQIGLGSGLLILGLSQLDINGRFVPPKWTMLLGSASYSIYLVHFPVISVSCKLLLIIHRFLPISAFSAFLIVTALGVASGIGLHVFVEKPLLRIARRAIITSGPDIKP